MTDIYSGTGWFSKTQVGVCGNGDIYKGYGWGKTQIGSYKDGNIYSGYGWGKTQIGMYRNGAIYSGYGWGKCKEEFAKATSAFYKPGSRIIIACN